ncbi:unnamed protein product [Cuscuta europaea]|uniref:Uncharacterized protein n=1 Tax=Cuscuta europaea TaxID=41803 RepID=A0A9P0ZWM2_CUSEU|nr:unnamed protein product [Cuscuta europaea]
MWFNDLLFANHSHPFEKRLPFEQIGGSLVNRIYVLMYCSCRLETPHLPETFHSRLQDPRKFSPLVDTAGLSVGYIQDKDLSFYLCYLLPTFLFPLSFFKESLYESRCEKIQILNFPTCLFASLLCV